MKLCNFIFIYIGVYKISGRFTLIVLGARISPAPQVGFLALVEHILAPVCDWMGMQESPRTANLIGDAFFCNLY